jgi:hypothetical protein
VQLEPIIQRALEGPLERLLIEAEQLRLLLAKHI